MKKCSAAHTVIIDDASLLTKLGAALGSLDAVEVLVLPSSCFQRSQSAHCGQSDKRRFRQASTAVTPQLAQLLAKPHLRELHVLSRWDGVRSKRHVFTTEHVDALRTAGLRELHFQGVAMEPKALALLASRFASTMRELRIGGVVCHSPRATDYIESICEWQHHTKRQIN